MTTTEDLANTQFEQFLDDLCTHIQLVGGLGNPDTFRKMPLEELYKHLHPNDIIIGFRSLRMRKKYQLSHQMKAEVLYED